ncbi:MAG: sulfite exporter TauE/SafE family protein [Phycisphaerae bacterium]|nr:sulfite exporter TauE/SafE family protein [Phycisphaerae bacterium]
MPYEFVLLAALGLGVGCFGTLIGAGGGFILMPILLLLYPGRSPESLTSMSLAVVFFNAASGSLSYGRMKRIDYRSGLLFLSAGIPGAICGAWVVRYIPRTAFDLVFGLVLLAASLFIFFRPEREPSQAAKLNARFARTIIDAEGARHEYAYNLPLGIGMSFVVGFASTLLGIGGGIIHVPAMVHLLDFPVHIATATSHFILAAMSLAGTITHAASGTLAGTLPQTAALSFGAVVGAQFGARLSSRIHGRWIMKSLALALGLVGVRILVLAFWR